MLKNRHGDVCDEFQNRSDGRDVFLLTGKYLKQLQNSEGERVELVRRVSVSIAVAVQQTLPSHLLCEIQSRGLWVSTEQLTNQLTKLTYERSEITAEGLQRFLKNGT